MRRGPSRGWSEPPCATEPPFGGRRYSRLTWRARYMVPWAAAGLIIIGASSAFVMVHQPAVAHPRARTAFCGLVACTVLHSDASTSRVPTAVPSSSASPSSKASTRAAAAPPPELAPSPTPRRGHHHRPRPWPTPTPEPTETDPWPPSPDPTHTRPPPPCPLPSCPPTPGCPP